MGGILAGGRGRRMTAYLRQVATVETDFSKADKPDPFFNINEPADLQQAERIFAQSGD